MKALLIDSNSILNRAFFAVKDLKNSKGFPTNAIFGFYSTLEKILKEDDFCYVVAAFDLKEKTFRHKKYELYKKNRKKMPDELFLQLEKTKTLLNLLGIKICCVKGFEADDVLGSLSRIFKREKIKSVIATGDRDFFQIVDEFVTVRLSSKKEAVYVGPDEIFKKYGVKPKELIEVKALMGDPSDNIKGVKGIGEKTALALVKEFKTVENLFKNLDRLENFKRVKKLLEPKQERDMCFLSKVLGTICLDVPLEKGIEKYKRLPIKKKELVEFFKELELNKFLKEFLEEDKQEEEKNLNIKILKNPKISYVLEELKDVEFLDFYLEESLYIFKKDLVFEFLDDFKNEALKKIICFSEQKKRTTNLKEFFKICLKENLKISNVVFSCDLAAYLLNSLQTDFSLSKICLNVLNKANPIECFEELLNVLSKKIKEENLEFVLKEIEIPLAKILAEMELVGFKINLKELFNFQKSLEKEIENLKEEIFNVSKKPFNLNSTKELSNFLFNQLALKKGKKTKTGYSTDNEVLKGLLKFNPVVLKIMEYRAKTKLFSTYVVGLEKLVLKDGRIHSHFNQTKTRTGRISSSNPNIQNIPVKTELGKNMRKFFVAEKGNVLIDADYSQIELRVLASLSKDEKMLKSFKKGEDIHSLTAKQIFGVVSKETRDRAKTINFSVIYGVSSFSLAKEIGVSVLVAKKYINSFFEGYLGVKKYFEELIKMAKQTGKVETIFKRFRFIPEINSKSKLKSELGKRIAKNTPIQGSAADIIKIAMVKVYNALKKENIFFKMVLQVHDEILVEVLEKDSKKASEIVKQNMENAVSLNVPLICNLKVGKSWFETKD